MAEKSDRAMIVLFGSTGDLARRKLMPAFYNLFKKGVLSRKTPIVCVGRRPIGKKEFIALLQFKKFLSKADKKTLAGLVKLITYVQVDFSTKDFSALTNAAQQIEKSSKCGNNKIFYLATPPDLFAETVDVIKAAKLLAGKGWKRLGVEKPFGHSTTSARKLNQHIAKVFKEQEIYRVDHYLGKELVQNMLVFRFANAIFEQIWHKEFIDHVQISVAEEGGVEERGLYYDKAGAIRDMIQNHLLQMLALATMESPVSLDPNHIRDQKISIFKALQDPKPQDIAIGQYAGYRKEPKIDPKSTTETFAAVKLYINNKRWKGVPFYLRTGKKLAKRYAEINVVLKDVVCPLFCEELKYKGPNVITIRVQPNEGIAIKFNAKFPGAGIKLHPVTMDFCHTCLWALATPEAYETLIHEILRGNQTLFTRWEGVEESWKYTDKILKSMRKRTFPNYKPGSWGPKEAQQLMQRDKRAWIVSEDISG